MLSRDLWQNVFNDSEVTKEYFEVCSRVTDSKESEVHHILPVSIFPQYVKASWNLVRLSYQNHYKAHELLPWMCISYEHLSSMLSAWSLIHSTREDLVVDAEMYAKLKSAQAKAMSIKMSGDKNYFYGKRWCGELNHFYGKKHTDEYKELARQRMLSSDNPIRGIPQSEELVKKRMDSKRSSRVPDRYTYAQYDKEGWLIRTWTDLEIADSRVFLKPDVRRVCNGWMTHHAGYRWVRDNTGNDYWADHECWLEYMRRGDGKSCTVMKVLG